MKVKPHPQSLVRRRKAVETGRERIYLTFPLIVMIGFG